MAIAENKTRVAITIDKGVLERLDAYCARSGMSRSQYISYCVAHQLEAEERVTSGVMDMAREILTSMAEGLKAEEGKMPEIAGVS
jgi:metal-responsive CopG/Arc/MetJ family transcriptional regulator